jgi:hypothetical protein
VTSSAALLHVVPSLTTPARPTAVMRCASRPAVALSTCAPPVPQSRRPSRRRDLSAHPFGRLKPGHDHSPRKRGFDRRPVAVAVEVGRADVRTASRVDSGARSSGAPMSERAQAQTGPPAGLSTPEPLLGVEVVGQQLGAVVARFGVRALVAAAVG